MTDEELMAAYVAGDGGAFRALFSRLAPAVHAFFQRSFADRALADDLLQMTFLKIHRARKEYRQDASLRSWVFAIAARVRTDELRRRQRRPVQPDDARTREAEPAPAAERADRRAEDGEIAARVRAALGELPESQRIVVHLHRFEGMTFKEIAEVLGTSEGAVKLRAFRAYETLRERLKDLVGKEDAA